MNRSILSPEWARQSGVLLAWPGAHTDWADHLDTLEPVYAELARQIARREQVLIVCHDEAQRERAQNSLRTWGDDSSRVRFVQIPFNDTWTRDFGPITVLRNGRPLLLDFRFNGWGGRYPAELDDAVNTRLHAGGVFAAAMESVDMVLEGGSIDADGQGGLLTTASCLLSPGRNPQLDRQGVEWRLQHYLGAERVLWLEQGHLAGDDTGGHIDTLARFCNANTIAYTQCDDHADEHYESLQAMLRELAALRDAHGDPYRLVPLPLPAPIHNAAGQRLPASYANFAIINGAVLAPTYNDPADAIARQRLQQAFPRREIIGIDCTALIRQYGSLHCITMQFPHGVL